MSQQPGQSRGWTWDPSRRQWYYVDRSTNRRVYHANNEPRSGPTSATPASSAHHHQHPEQDASYPHGRIAQLDSGQRSVAPVQAARARQEQVARSRNDVPRASGPAIAQRSTEPTSATPRATGPQQAPQQQVVRGQAGGVTFSRDEDNQVQTALRTGPRENITDPAFGNAGIWARSYLLETPGEREQLFDSYRRRENPKRYFVFGRVFFVLWAEPQSDTGTIATGLERGTSFNRFNQPVYSKARRFVVIRAAENYCSCLPITTYQGQGVAKRGVKKAEHSVIFTDRDPPALLRGEDVPEGHDRMQPQAIRVNADSPDDKLTGASRLDYGKIYTIHHNLKVRNIGVVHQASQNALHRQFYNVWGQPPNVGEASSSSGAAASNAPAALRSSSLPRRVDSMPSNRSGHNPSRQAGDRRAHAQPGKHASESESESSSTSAETEAPSAPSNIQASAQAAIRRMQARGFTLDQATAAIRREGRRQRAAAQPGAEQSDSDQQSDDSLREGRTDQSRTTTQARSDSDRNPTHSRARRQSSSHGNSARLGAEGKLPVRGSSRAYEHQKQPLQSPQAAQSVGVMAQGSGQGLHYSSVVAHHPAGQPHLPGPDLAFRPPPPQRGERNEGQQTDANRTSTGDTITRQARMEDAIRHEMASKGISREKAIDNIRRRFEGRR